MAFFKEAIHLGEPPHSSTVMRIDPLIGDS